MNRIVSRILEKELYFDNTIILKYKIEYPEMIFSDYKKGMNEFNNFNKEKAYKLKDYIEGELLNDAKETYKFNKENNYPIMIYEVLSNYKITYNLNKVVSLYDDTYIFSGGAHGNTKRTSQNWNLYEKKQIKLEDFNYNKNPYFLINILQEINKQISDKILYSNKDFFDNYCELVQENFKIENFYIISNDTIVIYFQIYDIAPYYMGIQIFEINVEKNK